MQNNIEPIIFDTEATAFDLSKFNDYFNLELRLRNDNWMEYQLEAQIPTKKYGVMAIDFWYSGITRAIMKIFTSSTNSTCDVFEFDSKIFKEHIIKYMQKHIASWDEKAFGGLKEIIDFYNAVLLAPDTKKLK